MYLFPTNLLQLPLFEHRSQLLKSDETVMFKLLTRFRLGKFAGKYQFHRSLNMPLYYCYVSALWSKDGGEICGAVFLPNRTRVFGGEFGECAKLKVQCWPSI